MHFPALHLMLGQLVNFEFLDFSLVLSIAIDVHSFGFRFHFTILLPHVCRH